MSRRISCCLMCAWDTKAGLRASGAFEPLACSAGADALGLDEKTTIHHAMRRGAIGFVSKVETAETMVKTVQSILDGRYHLGWAEPEIKVELQKALTPRQREVLQFMHQEMSNKLIARRLDLSNNTVRRHVQDILEALELARAQFLVV